MPMLFVELSRSHEFSFRKCDSGVLHLTDCNSRVRRIKRSPIICDPQSRCMHVRGAVLCLLLKSRVKNSAPRPWRCIINPLTRSKRRLARTPPTHRTRRRAARCVCRPFIKYSKQRPAKPHISRRRRCCAAMKCTNYHAARTSSLGRIEKCAQEIYLHIRLCCISLSCMCVGRR
jgi:hypothetical protein